MWLSVLAAGAAIALGCLIALAPATSSRGLGPFHSFALLTSVAVVLGQLLPDALSSLGLPAFITFLAAFGAPRFLEWARARLFGAEAAEFEHAGHHHAHPTPGHDHGHQHDHGHGHGTGHGAHGDGHRQDAAPCSDLGLELGYGALLLHKIGDGVGLALFSGPAHAGHGHYDVLLAIAGHSVPVTALVVTAFRARRGARQGLLRGVGLLFATLIGVAIPATMSPTVLHELEPWLTAAVSGLLLHVVTHGWAPNEAPTALGRLMDLLALASAALLLLLGGGGHHHGHEPHAVAHLPEFRDAMVDALWRLGLETAPVLLLGLLFAAAIQTFGSRIGAGWLRQRSRSGQALWGAFLGIPLPVCACGILPVATSLRRRGAAPAFVVAFLLSTPELGIDTFVLSGRFLGWPFAVMRLLSAPLLAFVAAWLLSAQLGSVPQSLPPPQRVIESRARGPVLSQMLHHFDDLLYHVGAWTLVGLLAAAYADAVLVRGGLHISQAPFLDVLIVTALAIPSYVCASSATPLSAVLLAKGLSPGAVLVGLLLGPATNLATLSFLRNAYGLRPMATAIGGLIAVAWALAAFANWIFPSLQTAASVVGHQHDYGLWSYGSAALLIVLVLRAVWRSGLRTWLSSLGEVLVHDSDHTHGVAMQHQSGSNSPVN